MIRRIETAWEKVVFIGSITGLAFLIAISFFRYYYLIPAQKNQSGDYRYILQLKNENRELKEEIVRLQSKLEHEKE